MRIGLGVGDFTPGMSDITGVPATVDILIEQSQRAERDGFASCWFSNIFGFDAILAAALCGRSTSRIELGTAITPTFPRHPTAMAQQALSAQAACAGRFTLGIGLSHKPVIEAMFGLSFAKPYSHIREYLSVLTPLIRSGSVNFSGDEFQVNAHLAVTGATPFPVLLGALGPKMLALAGGEADGTITWMTGPKTLSEHIVPRINEAAADAGRAAPRVVVGLPIALTTDVAAGRESAERIFRVYGRLPSYRAMLDREGADGPGGIAIVGDRSALAEQLDRLRALGTTDYLAVPFPVGSDPQESLERTREFLVEQLPADPAPA